MFNQLVRKGKNDIIVNGASCQWVEMFASGQSELLACLPTVNVPNSLPQCSSQDIWHAQSKLNHQHKCYRLRTVAIREIIAMLNDFNDGTINH